MNLKVYTRQRSLSVDGEGWYKAKIGLQLTMTTFVKYHLQLPKSAPTAQI